MEEILSSYRTLGLEPGASPKAVKKAYRELVKKWHPDQFANDPRKRDSAEVKLREINLAFEQLQDFGSTRDLLELLRAKYAASPESPAKGPREEGPARARPRTGNGQPPKERAAARDSVQSGAVRSDSSRRGGFSRAKWMAAGIAAAAVFLFALPEKKKGASRQTRSSGRTEQALQVVGPSSSADSVSSGERMETTERLLKVLLGESTSDAMEGGGGGLQTLGSTLDDNKAQSRGAGMISNADRPGKNGEGLTGKRVEASTKELLEAAGEIPLNGMDIQEAAGPKFAKPQSDALKLINQLKETKLVKPGLESAIPPARIEPKEHYEAGLRFARGEGVPQDWTEAARLYREAAEGGHPEAQRNLGFLYASGKGVPKDLQEAEKWFGKAAASGQEGAGFASALLGLTKRVPAPTSSELPTAAILEVESHFQRGLRYATGEGGTQDLAEAAHWYRKAAEGGHAGAQKHLGLLYASGKGVPRDLSEAERWLRKASERGGIGTEFALAILAVSRSSSLNPTNSVSTNQAPANGVSEFSADDADLRR